MYEQWRCLFVCYAAHLLRQMLKVDITEIASQYLDISQFTPLFCIVCGCIRFAYAKYDSHNLRSGHMPWVIVRGISFRYSHVSNEGLPWLVWRHTRSRKGRNVLGRVRRGAPGYRLRAIGSSGASSRHQFPGRVHQILKFSENMDRTSWDLEIKFVTSLPRFISEVNFFLLNIMKIMSAISSRNIWCEWHYFLGTTFTWNWT